MYSNLIGAALIGIAHVVSSSGTGAAPDVHQSMPTAYVDLDCSSND